VTPVPPLSRLYRESFDDVWSALRRLGVDDAELEDAVHDVFVVAHRRRDAFEGRSSVRTWLLGIARRIAFRYRRTEARTMRRHRALAAIPPVVVDAHEHVALREAWLALQRFLEALDRPQREAFVLGELQRLGRRELGEALGVSPNTAYSRLRAARARFSEAFDGGRPSPRAVIAAGRRGESPPAETRQRVWLALAGGPGSTLGASTATAVGIESVLATAGLAGAVLGLVVVVAPGPAHGERASAAEIETQATSTSPPSPSDPSSRGAATSPSRVRHEAERVPATIDEPVAPIHPRAEPPVERSPRRPVASVLPSPTGSDALTAEAALLRTAHAALAGGDAAAALDALDEHQRRFPRGTLAEERDASTLHAECALGRHARAEHAARRFVAAHPGSAYLEALADSCVADVINHARDGDQGEQ
jgi:RNA polymerase sigma-70 factor (ECF subfamily)